MSLASWKKEYYPTPASSIKTDSGAVAHSIRKWKGLSKQAMKKHGIEWGAAYATVHEPDNVSRYFEISEKSCALCVLHPVCVGCPLAAVRRGYACDSLRPEEYLPPWQRRMESVRPMLTWLNRAAKMLKEKNA